MAGSSFNKPKVWRFTFNCLGTIIMHETHVPHPKSALETAKKAVRLKHGYGVHEIELLKSEKLSNV